MVPTPRSPQLVKILEVLDDGAWHHRDEILAAAAAVIPPGVAYRAAEKRRRERPGAPPQRTRGDTDAVISSGARSLARDALLENARRGLLERQGDWYRKATR